MIAHFQYKVRKNNLINREWTFSFFYKQVQYEGTYYKDGTIKWGEPLPSSTAEKKFLEDCVHDLMLYHVYEEH